MAQNNVLTFMPELKTSGTYLKPDSFNKNYGKCMEHTKENLDIAVCKVKIKQKQQLHM